MATANTNQTQPLHPPTDAEKGIILFLYQSIQRAYEQLNSMDSPWSDVVLQFGEVLNEVVSA